MPRVEWEILDGAIAEHLEVKQLNGETHYVPVYQEVTEGVHAMNLGVNTSGSIGGPVYIDWEARFKGMVQAYQNHAVKGLQQSHQKNTVESVAFWACAYCDTSVSSREGACSSCGAPKHRSVK